MSCAVIRGFLWGPAIPPESAWQAGFGATSFLGLHSHRPRDQPLIVCDPQMFGPFLSQFFIFLHDCFCVHVHIHMEIAMHTKITYVCLNKTSEYMMQNEAYIHIFMGFDQH